VGIFRASPTDTLAPKGKVMSGIAEFHCQLMPSTDPVDMRPDVSAAAAVSEAGRGFHHRPLRPVACSIRRSRMICIDEIGDGPRSPNLSKAARARHHGSCRTRAAADSCALPQPGQLPEVVRLSKRPADAGRDAEPATCATSADTEMITWGSMNTLATPRTAASTPRSPGHPNKDSQPTGNRYPHTEPEKAES